MKKIICKIFGHEAKGVDYDIFEFGDGRKTGKTKCERCGCTLFGYYFFGPYSKEWLWSFSKWVNGTILILLLCSGVCSGQMTHLDSIVNYGGDAVRIWHSSDHWDLLKVPDSSTYNKITFNYYGRVILNVDTSNIDSLFYIIGNMSNRDKFHLLQCFFRAQ